MNLPLTLYKWTKFICLGAGTFGTAFGMPFLAEIIFGPGLPKWLDVVLFFVGFFGGGIVTTVGLRKSLSAQCPRCKKPMRFVRGDGTVERYECADCWQQHEIVYPKLGVRR